MNDGYEEFLNGAIDILNDAGFLGLVPQGQSGDIDQVVKDVRDGGEVPDTMSLFFAATDRPKFHEFAIIFLGITKPDGFQINPLKRRVLIGRTLTKDEVKETARQKYPDSKSKYERISRFCLDELYQLIH